MTTKLLMTEAGDDLVLIFTSMIWLKCAALLAGLVILWFIEWLVNSGPGSKKKPVDESMVDLIISHCNAFFEPFPEQDHKRVANIEAYSRCCNVIEEMGKKLWALPYSHDEHSKLMEVLGSTRLEVSEWKRKYEETLDENGVRYHKPASSINENVLKYLLDFSGRQGRQCIRS